MTQLGYIDSISADRRRLGGWVSSNPDGTPPVITTRIFGVDVASRTTFGEPRSDVSNHLGIENMRVLIDLNQPTHCGALLAGDLVVEVDGIPLLLGSALSAAEAESAGRWLHAFAPSWTRDPHALVTGSERAPRPQSTKDVSLVPLVVGTRSKDGSAVIGHDGNLFIYGGSNALWRRYSSATPDAEVAGWTEILRDRAGRMEDRGIQFLQTVIPEKSSAIRSGIPELTGVTVALAEIEKLLKWEDWYVSTLQVLSRSGADPAWMRLDSHLAPAGTLALCRALFRRVEPSFDLPDIPFEGIDVLSGDLTERFFGTVIAETVPAPRSDYLDELGRSATLMHKSDATRGGRFVGLRRAWSNPAAPIPRRSLVFGNSFFGSDPRSASRLNYWFLRIFREHHFVWAPELDDGVVEQVRPDLVLCQTNERFLSAVPRS